MFKIAICGKANSGKNTTAHLLCESLKDLLEPNQSEISWNEGIKFIAFADPIKEMIKLMFPNLKRDLLYGPSGLRAQTVPGAFKDGQPLTIRQMLIDLGTGVGRTYKEDVWLDAFDHACDSLSNKHTLIVTDVRFRNEFNHLKNKNFYQIKLKRESQLQINHSSETNQDTIKDNEFNYIIHNNGSLDDLKQEVKKIAKNIISLQS
jgi:hypothetical protein